MVEQTDFVATIFDECNDPNKVTVAYTMGLNALMKGHTSTIILMVEAVHLAKPGKVDSIDIGAPFKPVKEVQQAYLEQGGKIVVCGACMEHNGVSTEEIDSRFPVISAPDVVDLLMAAKGSLQVT